MFWKENIISSSIEELINSDENVSLETVMDENDILQECKLQCKTLIKFLTKPESMEKMIDLIIKEPPDNVEESVRFKYPNIACELLTSDADEITDTLVGNNEYLDKLYSFLELKTEADSIPDSPKEETETEEKKDEIMSAKPLNPLLASFFSKALSILLIKRTEIMMEYLKKKEDFVTLIINHIGTSAIMDLWIKLVTCTEDNELHSKILNWLSEEQAIQKLVESIDSSVEDDKHSNASQTLCDIIRTSRDYMSQMQENADHDPLLSSIESTEMVSELFNHMLCGERKEAVIVNGINVILALLEFKKPLSIITPSPAMVCTDSKDNSDNHPAADRDPNALTTLDIDRMERGVEQILAALNTRLQDLQSLLQDPPQRDPMLSNATSLTPPLGRTRLQVARLIVALVRANVHGINVQMEKLGLINILLDLFFEYSYNNFLHTQVEQCIDVILANQPTKEKDSDSEPENLLLNQSFEQFRIIPRILEAWEQNESTESKPGSHRKGYMGHLTKIANHVIFYSENGFNSIVIEKYLKELPKEYSEKWENFVSGPLSETNKKNTIVPVQIVQNAPSSSVEEESSGYIEIAFPHETALQQMQQMTSNFSDQFGFQEEEFSDHDASNIISISQGVTFNISSNENSKSSDLFEQVCRQRLQGLDDNGSSDDDIWEDKDQEITFTSDTLRKRTSSDNSHSTGSTDSDEERDSFSDQSPGVVGPVTPGTTQSSSGSDDAKMDVDASDEWTANFDSVTMEETSSAMDIQDIWNSQSNSSEKQDSWANFATFDSDFSCQEPFSSSATTVESTKKSPSIQMETTESPQPNAISGDVVNSNSAISEKNVENSIENEPSPDIKNPIKMDSSQTDSNSEFKDSSITKMDSSQTDSNSEFKDSSITFPTDFVKSSSPSEISNNDSMQTSQKSETLPSTNESSIENPEKLTALPVHIESAQNGPA